MNKRCWLVAVVLIAGCNREVGTPTMPSSPKIALVTVSGPDLILIGKTEAFTAVNDSGAPVSARWGSDAPGVAQPDVAGNVTAVATGTATIFADAGGSRGTKLIRTLPNFGGRWDIYYRITHCEADGTYSGYCEFPPNAMYLELIQNREGVSGSFAMTDWSSYDFRNNDVSGSVKPDGTLSFTASARSWEDMKMENVRFEMGPNRRLAGTFEQVWFSGTQSAGKVRYFCELTNATGGNP